MNITLTAIADLSPAEQEELQELSAAVYTPEVVARLPVHAIEWAPGQWGVIGRDTEERVVTYVGIVLREAEHDGTPVSIGGIGGVKTHPAARGKGYAAAAMARAITFMADDLGVSFALLGCLPPLVPYYTRLGWRAFEGIVIAEQPGGSAPFTINLPMVHPALDPAPGSGTINLCGLPW